jgi:hypothetical protein
VNFDVLADYNPAVPGERRASRKPFAAAIQHERAPQDHPLPGAIFPGRRPIRPPYTGLGPSPGPANRPSPYPRTGGPQ